MKIILQIMAGMLLVSFSVKGQVRTTTISGSWTNPIVWSPAGVPDNSEDAIVINHVVTYTGNLVISPNDSIVVNSNGKLIGTGGTDSITSAVVIVNRGAICASHYAGDSIYNKGTISISNQFVIGTESYNTSTGKMYCGDSLIIGAELTNDGTISTVHFVSGDIVKGTGGKICISNTFFNGGNIIGTQDVCDATPGGAFDFPGSQGSGVTNCASGPCAAVGNACSVSTGINNYYVSERFMVYPNPNTGEFTVELNWEEANASLEIYNSLGALTGKHALNGLQNTFSIKEYPSGMYILKISGGQDPAKVVRLIKQ